MFSVQQYSQFSTFFRESILQYCHDWQAVILAITILNTLLVSWVSQWSSVLIVSRSLHLSSWTKVPCPLESSSLQWARRCCQWRWIFRGRGSTKPCCLSSSQSCPPDRASLKKSGKVSRTNDNDCGLLLTELFCCSGDLWSTSDPEHHDEPNKVSRRVCTL